VASTSSTNELKQHRVGAKKSLRTILKVSW